MTHHGMATACFSDMVGRESYPVQCSSPLGLDSPRVVVFQFSSFGVESSVLTWSGDHLYSFLPQIQLPLLIFFIDLPQK